MESYGSVQQKVSCVFVTTVLDEQSTKRAHQPYKVVASDRIKQAALDADVHIARPTEKLDGTCVYIADFEGKPWLWARFDRKPSKGSERKFRKFQQQQQKQASGEPSQPMTKYAWDLDKDFKDTPPYWLPASGVEIVDGSPVPDDIGHTPGWVPVSPSSRQHCWHLSAVDLTNALGLVLREEKESSNLCIEARPLAELRGHTAELIGTNINGNPYGIGNKKCPVHLLVVHGSISVRDPPGISRDTLNDWFTTQGQVEGIVWHCPNGRLFKLHRNHVSLPWPVAEPTLCGRSVEIQVDITPYELDVETTLIANLARFSGHTCDTIRDLDKLLVTDRGGNTDTGCHGDLAGSGDAVHAGGSDVIS